MDLFELSDQSKSALRAPVQKSNHIPFSDVVAVARVNFEFHKNMATIWRTNGCNSTLERIVPTVHSPWGWEKLSNPFDYWCPLVKLLLWNFRQTTLMHMLSFTPACPAFISLLESAVHSWWSHRCAYILFATSNICSPSSDLNFWGNSAYVTTPLFMFPIHIFVEYRISTQSPISYC